LLRVHELSGIASFGEYADRLFGFTGRQTEERLRVAEALEGLPALAMKLADGELCYSVVRELTRVCTHENEADWIDAAEGKTARQVERLVSGRELGDSPAAPVKAEAEVHRLVLEVSADPAIWKEASAMVGDRAAADDAPVAMMARKVLGPSGEGRSNHHQVAMNVCPRCETATVRAGCEHVVVDEATRGGARCAHMGCRRDAQRAAQRSRRGRR
jgi:hypothetical protein